MRGRRTDVTINRRADPASDGEARTTRTAPDTETVRGAVVWAGARTRQVAAQLGVDAEVVVQLPLGTTIDRTATVDVVDGPAAGTWAVNEVRRGPKVVRALCGRVEV